MKKFGLMLLMLLLLLSGCTGGQEIESGLFVIAMAVDAAPEGNLTVTVKALSGTEDGASGASDGEGASDAEAGLEKTEPGYIVLSATAPSCLRALGLLGATTPRTVNLSQLREIVVSQTLAETDATLSILKEIRAIYRANGEAVVVVTPDQAGDFIRRQRAVLGLRLSKYLEVLFEHYEQLDVIPPSPSLSAVIAAMESGTADAAAVYAAGNDFQNTLLLQSKSDLDRLHGHLPRTAPAPNENMGAARSSGPPLPGQLTGHVLHVGHLLDHALGGLDHLGLQPVALRQDLQPFGNMEIHLSHRKLLQDALQDMENIILFQLFAVDRHNLHSVFFLKLRGQLLCLI